MSAERIHLIGIGGAGMSGIARVLIAQGASISGSDAKESRRLTSLRALGAEITIGHDPVGLTRPDDPVGVVVASTAIPADNIELQVAREQGIAVWTRATALAYIMRDHQGVAIAGTHGKTTTTSMLTVALQAAGGDPSFVIGSELQASGANAHLGSGPSFVVEADESDGSFLQLTPHIAVVTNVEADHLDHWADAAQIDEAFADFVALVNQDRVESRAGVAHPGNGTAVICIDDPGGRRLVDRARQQPINVITYGTSPDADFRIDRLSRSDTSSTQISGALGWTFDVVQTGVRLGPITLAVPGHHNALNATAALAAGVVMGYPEAALRAGLAGFTGTRRRFELRGTVDDIRVFDDYAHHPTEVTATLAAAREIAGAGRVVVAFQSHRYTRTAAFMQEFAQALAAADEVVVLEVYPAGEDPILGASGEVLADALVNAGLISAIFEPSWSSVPQRVADVALPGDVVLTMGAGDVGMLAPQIIDRLRATAHVGGDE